MRKNKPSKGIIKLDNLKADLKNNNEFIGLTYWSTDPDKNADADPDINWKEGQLPSTVNNSARTMMARLKENNDVVLNKINNINPIAPHSTFVGILKAKYSDYSRAGFEYLERLGLNFKVHIPKLEYLYETHQFHFEPFDLLKILSEDDRNALFDPVWKIPILEISITILIGPSEEVYGVFPCHFDIRIGDTYTGTPYFEFFGPNNFIHIKDWLLFSNEVFNYERFYDEESTGDELKITHFKLKGLYSDNKTITSQYLTATDSGRGSIMRFRYNWLNTYQIQILVNSEYADGREISMLPLPFAYDSYKAVYAFYCDPVWYDPLLIAIRPDFHPSYSFVNTSSHSYADYLVFAMPLKDNTSQPTRLSLKFTIDLRVVRDVQQNRPLLFYLMKVFPPALYHIPKIKMQPYPEPVGFLKNSKEKKQMISLIPITDEEYYDMMKKDTGVEDNGK